MSAKFPIIKLPAGGMSIHDFIQKLPDNFNMVGGKVGISFKRGVRRKLQKFRVVDCFNRHCESCGNYIVLILRKGEITHHFDTHFGSSWIGFC